MSSNNESLLNQYTECFSRFLSKVLEKDPHYSTYFKAWGMIKEAMLIQPFDFNKTLYYISGLRIDLENKTISNGALNRRQKSIDYDIKEPIQVPVGISNNLRKVNTPNITNAEIKTTPRLYTEASYESPISSRLNYNKQPVQTTETKTRESPFKTTSRQEGYMATLQRDKSADFTLTRKPLLGDRSPGGFYSKFPQLDKRELALDPPAEEKKPNTPWNPKIAYSADKKKQDPPALEENKDSKETYPEEDKNKKLEILAQTQSQAYYEQLTFSFKYITKKPNIGLLADSAKKLKRNVDSHSERFIEKAKKVQLEVKEARDLKAAKSKEIVDERTPLRRISVYTRQESLQAVADKLSNISEDDISPDLIFKKSTGNRYEFSIM